MATVDKDQDFTFFSPLKTCAGKGALAHIPFELKSLGVVKPLLLASAAKGSQRHLKRLVAAFSDSGMVVAVCDRVAEPTDTAQLNDLSALYRDRGCDAIVVMGGGAMTDTAKALNLLVSGPSAPKGAELWPPSETAPKIKRPLVVVMGSETSGFESSGWTTVADQTLRSEAMIPAVVVVDPSMLKPVNRQACWQTALQSLALAVEALGSQRCSPFTAGYATMAARLVLKHLPLLAAGKSIAKQTFALTNAALAAGCVFDNTAPGAVYCLGQVTAKVADLHPGTAMGLLLPYVLANQLRERPQDAGHVLAAIDADAVVDAMSGPLQAGRTIAALHDFLYQVHANSGGKIPLSLKDCDVGAYLVDDIVSAVMDDPCYRFDPEQLRSLLNHAVAATPLDYKS